MLLVSLVRAFPARYKWGIGLAVVAVLLGGIGWYGSGIAGISSSDIAYRAFAVLGFSDIYKDLPKTGWARLPLEAARFLGPFALFVLAGSALFDLVHKSDIRGKASKSAGTNAIIVGSGPFAYAAVGMELPAMFKRIVHLGAGVLSHSGRVFRLPWENTGQKTDLVSEFARRAEYVIVAESNDAETLLLALAAQKAEPRARVTAVVKDNRLADDFSDMLAGDNKPAHPLRVLSVATLAARDLHLNHPPFLAALEQGQKRIHAVIVGFGDTGEAIARDIATNCLVLGLAPPRLTVIDPAIAAREAALRLRVPELDETVTFVGMQGAFGCGVAPPLVLSNDAGPITHIYLCLGSDIDTLTAAGAVRQWLRSLGQPDAPLFLRLRDGCLLPEGMGAVAFGDTCAIVGLSHWLDDAADEAAVTLHRGYRTSLTETRRGENQSSTTRNWTSLTPDVQRSNHAAVAHIPAKLASAGVDRVHWLGRSDIPKLSHASGLLSRLGDFSRLEHDRWNAERRWAGWVFSGRTRAEGGEKDTTRRLHPDLVPFDRLTPESRQYDVGSIELLERLLTGGDPDS
jgi:hypothetical protein